MHFIGIQNHIFQLYFKIHNIITLKIIYFNEIQTYIYKTALFTAVEKENVEIVKLLLTNDKIDVNIIII